MEQEKRERYHLGNFLWDCNEDFVKVKFIYQGISGFCSFARRFGRVWSYISILLFAFYGFYQGNSTGAWTLSYIIFGVCAAMLIANTVLLCMEVRSKVAEGVRRGVMCAFHWISTVLKLCMTVIVVCGLVSLGDVTSLSVRVVICLLSVFWLGVTLTVDVLMLVFTVLTHILKDIVAERQERLAAACKNTVKGVADGVVNVAVRKNPIAKGVHWVFSHIRRKRRGLPQPADETKASLSEASTEERVTK